MFRHHKYWYQLTKYKLLCIVHATGTCPSFQRPDVPKPRGSVDSGYNLIKAGTGDVL